MRDEPDTTHPAADPAADCVYCPDCGMPAWIEWADTLASTAGAVQHVKVRCFARHWFLMTREALDRRSPDPVEELQRSLQHQSRGTGVVGGQ